MVHTLCVQWKISHFQFYSFDFGVSVSWISFEYLLHLSFIILNIICFWNLVSHFNSVWSLDNFKFVVVVNQTVRWTLQYTWMISITFWFNSNRLVDVSLVKKCPKWINMKECVKLFMNIWYISETCWFPWKIKKTDREGEGVRMAIILKAN